MFQITARMPPGDRNLGFEVGAKALDMSQGIISRVIRDVCCKEVG